MYSRRKSETRGIEAWGFLEGLDRAYQGNRVGGRGIPCSSLLGTEGLGPVEGPVAQGQAAASIALQAAFPPTSSGVQSPSQPTPHGPSRPKHQLLTAAQALAR